MYSPRRQSIRLRFDFLARNGERLDQQIIAVAMAKLFDRDRFDIQRFLCDAFHKAVVGAAKALVCFMFTF
jgi:hypothetical protein